MGMVSACHCVFVCVTVMLSVAFHLRRHLGQRVCYALLDSSVGVLCASVFLFVVIKNEACPFARALRSSSCALTLRFFKLLKTKKCCQVPKREGEWEREIEREIQQRYTRIYYICVSRQIVVTQILTMQMACWLLVLVHLLPSKRHWASVWAAQWKGWLDSAYIAVVHSKHTETMWKPSKHSWLKCILHHQPAS